MITRIVRMTFDPKYKEAFINQFIEVRISILEMKGCLDVELYHDSKFPNIMTTISKWDSEEDLNNYRQSELFMNTWRKTKAMFCSKPIAQSYYHIKSH